ncbi:MAG: PAS domain S-box protein [Proteobacteria bacterium]|nr:PAS domain S-box protein [Pseudomonadota bacterium]
MQDSRKRFYALSNRTQDGIYSFNLAIRKYVYTNPAFIRMFGHPCKDIATTDSVTERVLEADRHKLQSRVEASLQDGKEGDEMEYRCVDNGGSVRWMHDRWVVLRDSGGVPLALEGIVRDITEMKDIIRWKDYLESVLESCMDAIVVTDPEGVIVLANRAATVLFRRPTAGLVGTNVGDVLAGVAGDPRGMFQLLLDESPTTSLELEARFPDGSAVPLLISSARLAVPESRVAGVISYMRDISVRKNAEERIRTLSQQLMRTKEVEMRGIAADLHDHLAQNLYALNIQLSRFVQRLDLSNPPVAAGARELSGSLQTIMHDARQMVLNIHPTGLHTLGIVHTLSNLCDSVARIHNVTIDFRSAGVESLHIDFDLSIAIYRIVQEGLSNIVKHAEPEGACIRLVYSYPTIIIRIEDDGRGFDAARLDAGGARDGCMGLWSMRERVALLNGNMTLTTAPGEGTSIVVEIPYIAC